MAASLSDLIAKLMMCVARAALSLTLNSSLECPDAPIFPFVVPAVPFFFVFVFVVDRAVREAALGAVETVSVSGSSNSLTVTTVAVVQVEVDATAALTASTFACNEAM